MSKTDKVEYVSVSEIAKILMVTDRRIQQLAKEGYIPKTGHGKYELVSAIQGYIAYLKSQLEEVDLDGEYGDLTDSDGKHKTRLTKARADKAEIELAEIKGELARTDVILDIVAEEYATVRTNLQGVSSKCANKLLHQDNIAVITDIIEKEIYNALRDLKYDKTG